MKSDEGEGTTATREDAPEEETVTGDDLSIYASREEGVEYRNTTYIPVAYDELDEAPEGPEYSRTDSDSRHRLLDLPKVPRIRHLIGPSAIMLGASLGSGETLFWPLLISQHGWQLYWAFLIGVLTQFVVNTEIQRWTIATGESVFRGFERIQRIWPLFFLFAGFASLGWPGWAATAAEVGGAGLGLGSVRLGFGLHLIGWEALGIGLMVFIWLTYQVTPLMYNVVERIQTVLVTLAAAGAVALFLLAGSLDQMAQVPGGALSIGTLPANVELAVFLGGLAYAGAGGYLNLSQSLWIREKGYGMGRYQGRIKNPLGGEEPETVHRNGFTVRPNRDNIERWRTWWRTTQLEHFVTFVVGLLIAATVMMSIAAEYAPAASGGAIEMWVTVIVPQFGALGSFLAYAVLFLALFTTEYAIVESFVRNSAEILYELFGRDAGWSLPRIFWGLLTVFVSWGILIIALPIPIRDSFRLLVIGAAMGGVMMWPYIALTVLLNTTRLPRHAKPSWLRVAAMWWATAFFGFFSILLVGRILANDFGYEVFTTTTTIVGSKPGGYLLWGVYLTTQLYTMARSTHAKISRPRSTGEPSVDTGAPRESSDRD